MIKLSFLLLFIGISSTLFADIKITGKVLDEQSQPMIGVAIMEKGTSKGTITSIDGTFSIDVKNEKSILQFSFISYRTKEIIVGNKRSFIVNLKPESKVIDEIVVIGYGHVKKSDLTGAVASLKSEELAQSGAVSFTSALTGKLSGVLAVQNGGAPGAGMNIKIRGASSVSAGVAPLYVVDGIMMGNAAEEILAGGRMGDEGLDPLAMINPEDIQSIEVLKDASATAIYGSRGANGVVLITTKSGIKNGMNISFSTKFGVDYDLQKRINVLSGSEYEDYMGLKNPLPSDFIPNETELNEDLARYWNPDGTIKHSGINTVWQDEIMRQAWSQDYNLSIRGGNGGKTTYYASIGYVDKDGIVKTTNMNRFSYNTKLNTKFNDAISLDFNLGGSAMENSGIISAHSSAGSSLFMQMLYFKPNISTSDVGDETLSDDDPGNPRNNPVNNINNTSQITKARRTQGNVTLTISPMKGLDIKSSFGGYMSDAKSKNYYSSKSGAGRIDNGRVEQAAAQITNWLNENLISYTYNKSKVHSFNALFGITFQKTIKDELITSGKDLDFEQIGSESINFANTFVSSSYLETSQLMSYLGRINYGYMNRYLITASIRADGSSKFTKGSKFSYFPSAAIAWRVSEENFLKDHAWIDMFKLRFSYGQTGNQGIGALSTFALMNKVYYNFNSTQGNTGSPYNPVGVIPATIGNDKLKWETTSQYDAGIDFSIYGGRISIIADYYYKHTRDLLITEQLAGISGYESRIRNIGSVENKGVELSLSTVNIKSPSFSWSTDFNISFNRNKVIDIGAGDQIAVTPEAIVQGHYSDVFYVKEGKPIGAMYGYKTDGLYQLSDFEEFYRDGAFITDPTEQRKIYDQHRTNPTGFKLREGVVDRGGDQVAPGYIKLQNLEKEYLGSAEPKFFGGFTNNFKYKGLGLSVFLQYSYGNKLFNANHALLNSRASFNVEREYYYNMWSIDKQGNEYRSFHDDLGRGYATDLQAEDASYLKIKDVTFSYNFPRRILNKLDLSAMRLFVSAKNLYTFTKYSWYDPEYASRNPLTAGLDKYSYPTAKSVMFGVNIEL